MVTSIKNFEIERKIKFIFITIILSFVFLGSGNAAPHAQEDNDSGEEFIKTEESPSIKFVKNGVIPRYSTSVTIGNALEYWAKQQNCDSTTWEEYETERKELVVSFSCFIDRYDFPIIEDTNNYKFYKKEIESCQPSRYIGEGWKKYYTYNADKIKEWEKYYSDVSSEFTQFEYLFQFLISVDGKTFNKGFSGYKWYFMDGKTYEQPNNYLLQIAYRGNKEENPIKILEGDFGKVIYQNRK